MQVDGHAYRSIWLADDGWRVAIIDQTKLPHEFVVVALETVAEAAVAIEEMWVRGAPLIGATAAYGMALAMREDAGDDYIETAYRQLLVTRPTAVNLRWALDDLCARLTKAPNQDRVGVAYQRASEICEQDVAHNAAIGEYGMTLIEAAASKKGDLEAVNILTHCNAGWLATVDWGTALAPIYKAHAAGINVHVWVDETRPRNQGAQLTAWELGKAGISHHVICDNAGGHLMQHNQVDLCLVGSDRTTASGDVCNKIGTYLKALAADHNRVPFCVALPSSTIDWQLSSGQDIPIEERDQEEVRWVGGKNAEGEVSTVCIVPEFSPAANPAFDVTPAQLVTTLITERGLCAADSTALATLFPEHAPL